MKKCFSMLVVFIFVIGICFVGKTPCAKAALIDGTIGFAGTVTPTPAGDLSAATGLTFGSAFVLTTEGDYNVFNPFQSVLFTNFTFTPFSSPQTLWTIFDGTNTATFEMTSVTVGQTSTHLTLDGIGELTLTGRDPHSGTFAFSTSGVGTTLVFSSNAAVSTPEPVTMLLLGIGLVGLVGIGATRRLRGAKKE